MALACLKTDLSAFEVSSASHFLTLYELTFLQGTFNILIRLTLKKDILREIIVINLLTTEFANELVFCSRK
jgi:hypothetical protein